MTGADSASGLHIVVTANAAWNILNFRKPLVEAMLADGHRVTVLAPEDESVGRLKEIGCDFVSLAMDVNGINPLNDLALMARFLKVFRALQPDLVLGFTIKNNLFGSLAARLAAIQFVPTVTGLGTAFLSLAKARVLIEFLYRRAFTKAPVVIFQNDDDASLFVARGLVREEQVRVVAGSGIDLSEFRLAEYPAADAETRVLLVARLIRDKGVGEFVEAARELRRAGVPVKMQLMGEAGAANRTAFSQEEVQAWHDSGDIEYLGALPDPRDAMRAAHVIALPSYREGAPRTLIEAGALGRPAIASDVAGCRAVVEDGVTGILCRVRESRSLADAIARFVMLDHADKAAMGEAARNLIEERFAIESVLAEYRRVIAGQARGTASHGTESGANYA